MRIKWDRDLGQCCFFYLSPGQRHREIKAPQWAPFHLDMVVLSAFKHEKVCMINSKFCTLKWLNSHPGLTVMLGRPENHKSHFGH